MTREKIIDGLKAVRTIHNGNYAPQIGEAIKLLEQEPIILDKIRVEIELITGTMEVSYNQYVSKIDVLQIIDKYKAESEKEE